MTTNKVLRGQELLAYIDERLAEYALFYPGHAETVSECHPAGTSPQEACFLAYNLCS